MDRGVNVEPQKLYRNFILPGIVPVGVFIVTAIVVIAIGQTLLSVYEHGTPELERLDLWIATLGSLAVLGLCAFLATRPAGSLGPLDREIAIGSRPMLAPPLPPASVQLRRGPQGTLKDLQRGYAIYARNGQLGVVQEVLPEARAEWSHLRLGILYAEGVRGANSEMWIPLEAVSAVYPETNSAFLAIAGDEIEAFGWHKPPASWNLHQKDEGYKLY